LLFLVNTFRIYVFILLGSVLIRLVGTPSVIGPNSASEMTCITSDGALNSTHSLTHRT